MALDNSSGCFRMWREELFGIEIFYELCRTRWTNLRRSSSPSQWMHLVLAFGLHHTTGSVKCQAARLYQNTGKHFSYVNRNCHYLLTEFPQHTSQRCIADLNLLIIWYLARYLGPLRLYPKTSLSSLVCSDYLPWIQVDTMFDSFFEVLQKLVFRCTPFPCNLPFAFSDYRSVLDLLSSSNTTIDS